MGLSFPARTIGVILCVVAIAPSGTLGGATEELTRRAERVAAELPWLSPGDVVYDRDPRWGPDAERAAALWRELTAPLPEQASHEPTAATSRPATAAATTRPLLHFRVHPRTIADVAPDELLPLLKHENAKVRTLGIALLLKLDRLDVMPDIAALVDDPAETFPAPAMISNIVAPQDWPMEPKTVGDYAKAVVERYVQCSAELEEMRRAGKLPRDGAGLARVFREMAATRDPSTNTATLRFAMERATGGISPMPGERDERVQRVLMRLGNVPMPRRFFVAHALDAQRRGGERYMPNYLLDLARQVPREVRLAALNGERAVSDPDLAEGAGWDYITGHAVELLRPGDIELLLRLDAEHIGRARGTGSEPYVTARYAIAAARLAPARAEAILIHALEARSATNESWQTFDEAAEVAAALAELGGEAGVARASDWFFNLKPSPGAYGFGREKVLARLESADAHRYRRFVARVIRDGRLFTLGPASTRLLVRAAQGYSGLAIADEEQIRDSYGVDEAQRDRKPPYLAAWQRSLRETIDTWDPPAATKVD